MKTKIRALIILLILCVFLALIYALLPAEGDGSFPARGEGRDALSAITDIPAAEAQALAISNGRGLFGLLNGPGGVIAVSDMAGPFDAAEMRALLYLACHLKGRRLDKFSPNAAALADSLARLSLILTGGREYNFALLRKSPVSDEYLLFSEEEQAVFLIPESSAEWLLRGAVDFFIPAAPGAGETAE
ncbi:MAG: hypothetical protein LBD47_10475 [Treponema sp.]|nr:hypothetical protein [Treponema sp.]